MSSLDLRGDGVCGQSEVSICRAKYINVPLFGMQLGEAAFEYCRMLSEYPSKKRGSSALKPEKLLPQDCS